jgi:sugar/nucleoside kinase (ribokinase family)
MAPAPRRGIAAAGNWIVDRIKVIDAWPQEERLANVLTSTRGGGGGAHNVLIDLARMGAPFPLLGIGYVGNDEDGRYLIEEAREYKVDFSGIRVSLNEPTSFTDVMSVKSTGKRTFFHARGANALLAPDDIDPGNAKIFHLAYLLLLDQIDPVAPMLLRRFQAQGIRTSVDVVSAERARFAEIVVPALDHVDYLILNEIEAGEITGQKIRLPDGTFDREALEAAAHQLWRYNLVTIHMPEGAFALSKEEEVWMPSRAVKEIVSTVGAGDAFAAGMLFALHEDWPLNQALDLAHACAAACLCHETTTGGLRPIKDL